jgi:hypothetical protein
MMQMDDILQPEGEQYASSSSSSTAPTSQEWPRISQPLIRQLITDNQMSSSSSSSSQSNDHRFITPIELRARQYRCPDFATILDTISVHMTHRKALKIAEHLQNHFRMRNTQITGLRATEVEQFAEDAPPPSPMIEWREGKNRDMLAFFKTLDGDVPCSWLMHAGVGICWQARRRWNQSSLAWGVTDLGHLKELFGAAQHILGLLQWSPRDLMKLCVENSPKDCSMEEYVPFFTRDSALTS